jgi:hypothetical protein
MIATLSLMTDLQPLIKLSALVAAEPSEEHLEAFLQAYNATQPPQEKMQFIMFEVLGDMTITEYLGEPETEEAV